MSKQERDTHFQGFARLSWDDVRSKVHFVTNTGEEYLDERIIALLAQHDYDLAMHVTSHVAATTMDTELILRFVPDFTAWSEQHSY